MAYANRKYAGDTRFLHGNFDSQEQIQIDSIIQHAILIEDEICSERLYAAIKLVAARLLSNRRGAEYAEEFLGVGWESPIKT